MPEDSETAIDTNIRLNACLHLAQILSIGSCRRPIVQEEFFVGSYCGVIPSVWDSFDDLIRSDPIQLDGFDVEKEILDGVFQDSMQESVDRIIVTAQFDKAWRDASVYERMDMYFDHDFYINLVKRMGKPGFAKPKRIIHKE